MSSIINENNNPNLDAVNPSDMIEINAGETNDQPQQQQSPPLQQQQSQQQEETVAIPVSEYKKYLGSSGTILVNRTKSDNKLDLTLRSVLQLALKIIDDKIALKQNALIPGENE